LRQPGIRPVSGLRPGAARGRARLSPGLCRPAEDL
jgi:hypothetical protein